MAQVTRLGEYKHSSFHMFYKRHSLRIYQTNETFGGRDAGCTFTKARVFAGGEQTEDHSSVSCAAWTQQAWRNCKYLQVKAITDTLAASSKMTFRLNSGPFLFKWNY